MENFDYTSLIPIIPTIGCLILFGLAIRAAFSSKTKNKMMKNQMGMMKDMTTGDMGETLKDLSSVAINIRKNILEENEDTLKEIKTMEADIEKGAITTKAAAVKEGFTKGKTMFCKHCGASIDADSKFCKECGKQL